MRIQIQNGVLVELPGLGDIPLPQPDVEGVCVLEISNFQSRRPYLAGISFKTDFFLSALDLRISSNNPRTDPPASRSR